MGNIIVWFRRDLRVNDNIALYEAYRTNKNIIPLFILDTNIFKDKDISSNRLKFIFSSLKELNNNLIDLGSKLILRKGNPLDELKRIIEESEIDEIYFNRDYEPYAIKRDKEIWEYFKETNIKIKSFKDLVLHEKKEIIASDGNPYTVFTHYYLKWSVMDKLPMYPNPDKINTPNLETLNVDFLDSGDIEGGEMLSREILKEFLSKKIFYYEKYRDFPSYDVTSRLSPHLRFGTISIRTVYHNAKKLLDITRSTEKRNNIEFFIRQLAWRDFYFQIIYNFPHVGEKSFKLEYENIKWDNNIELYQRWCNGMTGYPFVDAGIRQLLKEGWMHNRLRMVTASFLTKDLLIDWKWGEKFFKEHLIDYDLALNNGGWQWSASTGTDAQPYFRIFNPISQSKKFDPKGEYIKKYISELRNVPTKYIHEPYRMPFDIQMESNCIIGKDYPYPIVDHSVQRKLALNIFSSFK